MDKLKVSLIIPAYNEEHYIEDCLNSIVLNVREYLHEIIVVDNASTDKTNIIASSFCDVKVIKEENKGLTKARQKGYKAATGNILVYIDADSRIHKNWFPLLVKEFQNPKIVCLSGPYKYYDLPKSKRGIEYIWRLACFAGYIITGKMVLGGNFAIRKEVLDQMKGFDSTISFYGEDTDIANRAYKFGKIKYAKKFYVYTSSRRFNKAGWIKTTWDYTVNYFSQILFQKSYSHEYKDYR